MAVANLAQAITQMENTNPSLNNPGALTWAPSTYCQNGKQGILVQFCSLADGQAALDNQIRLNVNRGLSLDTFFGGTSDGSYAGYAPAAAGNNPVSYASSVASWLGIDPSQPLSTLDSGLIYSNGTGQPSTSLTTSSFTPEQVVFDTSNLTGGIDPLVLGIGAIALLVVIKLMS